MLSLDDYFRNRDEMGNENWENLEALDLTLFEDTVSALLEGREVHLPHFNFITGKKNGIQRLSVWEKDSLFWLKVSTP